MNSVGARVHAAGRATSTSKRSASQRRAHVSSTLKRDDERAVSAGRAASKRSGRAVAKAEKEADDAAAAARAKRAADLKPRAINKFVYAVLALVAATAARGVALKAAADARGRGLKPIAVATGGARAAAAGAGAAVESDVRASAARTAAPAQEVLGATVAAAVAAMGEAPLRCGDVAADVGHPVLIEAAPTRACAAGAPTHASVMCQTQLANVWHRRCETR